MNLENSIKDVISKKLEDGTVEKLVSEQLEKGVNKALEDLFGSYGDVTKIIKEQIKSVIIPYLEGYDYSKYITKLDGVLVDVLMTTTNENRSLLENFKELMASEKKKEIKVSELFEEWKKYVAENVETQGLEICYDDSPSYYPVDVSFDVIKDESRSWSSFSSAKLVFECEHDEAMNFEINLSKYNKPNDKSWDIRYEKTPSISSLRYINKFDILLMNLTQNGTKLIADECSETDEVYPEAEPEASFN